MSAFIHDHAHIDALVGAGMPRDGSTLRWKTTAPEDVENGANRSIYTGWIADSRYRELRADTASTVGQMLVAANRASVNARYPDDGDPLPTPYEYTPALGNRPFKPIEILLAISSFEYQSCEVDDWDTSEAAAFCNALRGWMIRQLPGYREARTWSIDPATPTLHDTTRERLAQ